MPSWEALWDKYSTGAPARQRQCVEQYKIVKEDKPAKKKFKQYPIGYFHIDIAEVRTEQGKLYLFVAIDRTSKFSYAQLHERATRRIAADFLRALVAAVPYTIHALLTDNGTHFVDNTPEPALTEEEIEAVPPLFFRVHAFAWAGRRIRSNTAAPNPNIPGPMGKLSV